MKDEQNNNDKSFFKSKNFKKTLLGSLIVVLITLIITIVVKGKNVKIIHFSNAFFISANIFLILGVFLRLKAWKIHKKSVLKKKSFKESSHDPALENKVLRFAAKSFGFIGLVNFLISIIFSFFFYY